MNNVCTCVTQVQLFIHIFGPLNSQIWNTQSQRAKGMCNFFVVIIFPSLKHFSIRVRPGASILAIPRALRTTLLRNLPAQLGKSGAPAEAGAGWRLPSRLLSHPPLWRPSLGSFLSYVLLHHLGLPWGTEPGSE